MSNTPSLPEVARPSLAFASDDPMKCNITGCPRCHGDHQDLVLTTFDPPVEEPRPIYELDPVMLHYWTMCPVKQAPILVYDSRLSLSPVRWPLTHEKVAAIAYSLWELDGRPHGRDKLHWEVARLLCHSSVAFKLGVWWLKVGGVRVRNKVFEDSLEALGASVHRYHLDVENGAGGGFSVSTTMTGNDTAPATPLLPGDDTAPATPLLPGDDTAPATATPL
jgi:hypothetical protein